MEGRGSMPLADAMGELGVLHGKEGGSCVPYVLLHIGTSDEGLVLIGKHPSFNLFW